MIVGSFLFSTAYRCFNNYELLTYEMKTIDNRSHIVYYYHDNDNHYHNK